MRLPKRTWGTALVGGLAVLTGLTCVSEAPEPVGRDSSGRIEAFVKKDGRRPWLIVQSSGGQEITAVRFDAKTGAEDYSTQRFFGFDQRALARMADRGRHDQIPPECFRAAHLWQGEFVRLLKGEKARGVLKRQSELLAICLDFIGGEHSDGCSRVPDFDFRGCCITHDICYESGGSARDRLRCDVQLRDCIANKGHPFLAQIYFAGVRAFGRSGFRSR